MTTIGGGSSVKGGYYLSSSTWEVVPVQDDGERLPGTSVDRYVRLPLAAALLLMPVLGALMVVFLPFIGLALTAQAAAAPVVRFFQRSGQDLASTLAPGWAPGSAHFTGKRTSARELAEAERMAALDAELDRLAGEIEARRRSESAR